MPTSIEVLKETVSSRFTACGTSFAEVEGTTGINLWANFGTVLIHGDGWVFDSEIICRSDLRGGHLSVIGTYGGRKYTLKFTRKAIDRYICLSLNSVRLEQSNTVSGIFARLLEKIS